VIAFFKRMFGTDEDKGRGEESIGESDCNIPKFSIFKHRLNFRT
jgi:hypothetical protein